MKKNFSRWFLNWLSDCFQRFDKDSVLKCLDKPTGCAVKRCRENDRQREKETERETETERGRETERPIVLGRLD